MKIHLRECPDLLWMYLLISTFMSLVQCTWITIHSQIRPCHSLETFTNLKQISAVTFPRWQLISEQSEPTLSWDCFVKLLNLELQTVLGLKSSCRGGKDYIRWFLQISQLHVHAHNLHAFGFRSDGGGGGGPSKVQASLGRLLLCASSCWKFPLEDYDLNGMYMVNNKTQIRCGKFKRWMTVIQGSKVG